MIERFQRESAKDTPGIGIIGSRCLQGRRTITEREKSDSRKSREEVESPSAGSETVANFSPVHEL